MSKISNLHSSDKGVTILRNALEHFDRNMDKLDGIYKKIDYVTMDISVTDDKESTMVAFDKDGKEIFTSKIQFLGVYMPNANLWQWAWATHEFYKNASYISRKMLYYGLDLPPEYFYLKNILLTSRFEISDEIQLELFKAIASYLTKVKGMFTFIQKSGASADRLYPSHALSPGETRTEFIVFVLDV